MFPWWCANNRRTREHFRSREGSREEGGGRTAPASRQPRISRRAAATSWADIYGNILVRVSGFLPCRADRVHMAYVNRHSRAAVNRPPPPPLPPQLPWVIFPHAEPAAPTVYIPLTASYHLLDGLPPDVRGAEWRGSGDGGWLVLELKAPPAHALYNLNSGERIALPLVFTSPADKNVFPLVLQSATLSASPSNDPNYMVAAIALVDRRPTAAFWMEGRATWFSTGGPFPVMPQDVIYFEGAFFFVTPSEDLIRFGHQLGPNGGVILTRQIIHTVPRHDVGMLFDHGSMKRYLVNSRGSLLMVLRRDYNPAGGTGFLQVFEITRALAINVYQPPYRWKLLFELSGRMLFLGPGCSRSFEVAHYNGFGEGTMYFLDENFYDMPPVGDDGSGRYTIGDLIPVSWPPGRPLRSRAPPIWWLH